ncbi:MAG: NAD(P)-dependent oxidoreductase [Anaerolineales bacterium]|nr:NAD(P)-dependent oxidoreductase [Anaerolineales bacterium]
MTKETCFVTGATGCIGAWVVNALLNDDTSVTVLDHGGSRHRLELIIEPHQLEQVRFIRGDITELQLVRKAIEVSNARYIIHLAALQLPFCRAMPSLGARVNVEGTMNVFEAARQSGLKRVVYASSTAVYGLNSEYDSPVLPHDAHLNPGSLYGIYKQANESIARVYWLEYGVSSIGIRPHVVYGPGRDQGMTSEPSKAMLATAAGRPYTISFNGRYAFQFVKDVAETFVRSMRADFEGANVFNLGGGAVSSSEIISAIEEISPSYRGKLSAGEILLPFPGEFDNSELEAVLGKLSFTPLEEGISQSMTVFNRAMNDGQISTEFLDRVLAK